MCTSQIEIDAYIINFDSKDRIFHYPKYYPRCQVGQKLERGCGTSGFKGTIGHKESIPPGPGVNSRGEGGACSEGHDAQKCSAQIICPFLALVVLCSYLIYHMLFSFPLLSPVLTYLIYHIFTLLYFGQVHMENTCVHVLVR